MTSLELDTCMRLNKRCEHASRGDLAQPINIGVHDGIEVVVFFKNNRKRIADKRYFLRNFVVAK